MRPWAARPVPAGAARSWVGQRGGDTDTLYSVFSGLAAEALLGFLWSVGLPGLLCASAHGSLCPSPLPSKFPLRSTSFSIPAEGRLLYSCPVSSSTYSPLEDLKHVLYILTINSSCVNL